MFYSTITKWFTDRGHRPVARPARTVRPQLECLEGRDMPALLGAAALLAPPSPAAQAAPMLLQQTKAIGQKMADYLQGQVNAGRRIGGGECAHLATEALRVAGGDFTRTEPAGTKDYVWSTNRVARLTNGSQLAGKQFQVGDIIQYHNATFSSGGSGKLAHHTQVVAAVDSRGRITHVFEQNIGGNRTAQRRTMLDLSKLNGGSVSIYRPVARTTQTGRYEFTVVNNTNSSRTYTLQVGNSNSTKTLDKKDTATSFTTQYLTGSSSAPKIKIGNTTLTVQNGAGYEIFTTSTGQVSIRKI